MYFEAVNMKHATKRRLNHFTTSLSGPENCSRKLYSQSCKRRSSGNVQTFQINFRYIQRHFKREVENYTQNLLPLPAKNSLDLPVDEENNLKNTKETTFKFSKEIERLLRFWTMQQLVRPRPTRKPTSLQSRLRRFVSYAVKCSILICRLESQDGAKFAKKTREVTKLIGNAWTEQLAKRGKLNTLTWLNRWKRSSSF